jgi:hypothetical protein
MRAPHASVLSALLSVEVLMCLQLRCLLSWSLGLQHALDTRITPGVAFALSSVETASAWSAEVTSIEAVQSACVVSESCSTARLLNVKPASVGVLLSLVKCFRA